MIVPMKKVSLLVLDSQKENVLKKLRKLGVLHIEVKDGLTADFSSQNEKISILENSVYSIEELVTKDTVQKEADTGKAVRIAKKVRYLKNEINLCRLEIAPLQKELDRLEEWGEIKPEELEYLRTKGIETSLHEMATKEYESLGDSVKTICLKKSKTSVKFITVGDISTLDDNLYNTLKGCQIKLPDMSTSDIKAKISGIENYLSAVEKELCTCGEFYDGMKNAIISLKKKIEFETYSVEMDKESITCGTENTVNLAFFTGYVQADDLNKLKNVARENSWGLTASDPTPDDNPPTEIRNNKFISLIYPLTDFLGTVPGYFEYDISACFLFFILIFFGIIFGDGGYGVVICAIAGGLILKSKLNKKPVPPAFPLIMLLGGATIIWGALTCTWFSIDPALLPKWLKAISIPVISNVNADKIWYPFWTDGKAGLTTSQNVQIVCFALALVQLSYAHIKALMRNRKSLKMLGDLGSVLQLAGIFYLVLSLVVNSEVFSFGLVISGIPIGTISIALIGIGFLMTFIFANYEGKLGESILNSLKNIVSVLLGVVNVFSDIVSYIRLWAVGLAGAAISATVNELASPMLGNLVLVLFAVVLLVFGHGLNMILNVLSVIVHGVRLNTLEFSSHLDMSWSGHKFKPFEE